MIPWIQVYSNLIRHPKVTKLADKLNLTSKDAGANVIAAGMLVSLWLWAAQNATDGDLSECTDRAIAEAAEYKKKPALFVEALIHAKLLDEDRKLHDWYEYATLLIDCEDQQREKTRKRVEKHRLKKKALQNADCNVTVTPCNAPTIPNLTKPNITVTEERKNMVGDTGSAEGPLSDGSLFTAFWNAYPENARYDREEAWEAWKKLNPTQERAAQIMEFLGHWKASKRWTDDGGAFIPSPKNFLNPDKSYLRTKPAPAKQTGCCNWPDGKRPLDEDDIEAIRRLMAKKEERENESCP